MATTPPRCRSSGCWWRGNRGAERTPVSKELPPATAAERDLLIAGRRRVGGIREGLTRNLGDLGGHLAAQDRERPADRNAGETLVGDVANPEHLRSLLRRQLLEKRQHL